MIGSAIAAGVPADATDAIVKLADLSGVKTDTGIDQVKVAEAVKAVLDRFPQFAAAPAAGEQGGAPVPPSAGVGAGPSQAEPQKTRPSTFYEVVMNDPRFAR